VLQMSIERIGRNGSRLKRDKNNASTGLTCAKSLDPTREFSFSATVNVNSHILKRVRLLSDKA
jgi:hypothetical protein